MLVFKVRNFVTKIEKERFGEYHAKATVDITQLDDSKNNKANEPESMAAVLDDEFGSSAYSTTTKPKKTTGF